MVVALFIVEHSIVVLMKVPTMNIVYEAIAIVIDAVAWDLAGVCPNVVAQILVIDINATIQHADHDRAAARRNVPRLLRLNKIEVRLLS